MSYFDKLKSLEKSVTKENQDLVSFNCKVGERDSLWLKYKRVNKDYQEILQLVNDYTFTTAKQRYDLKSNKHWRILNTLVEYYQSGHKINKALVNKLLKNVTVAPTPTVTKPEKKEQAEQTENKFESKLNCSLKNYLEIEKQCAELQGMIDNRIVLINDCHKRAEELYKEIKELNWMLAVSKLLEIAYGK